MICKKCGMQNDDNQKFCAKCGELLKELDNDNSTETGNNLFSEEEYEELKQVTYVQHKKLISFKNLSLISIIILLEIVVLAVSVIFVSSSIKKELSTRNIVESYFETIISGDVEKTYDYYKLPKSQFLTKQMFVALNSDNKVNNITDYSIKYNSDNSDDKNRNYEITYCEDENLMKTVSVSAIKQIVKKYHIFDDWRIVPDNIYSTNNLISVEKGSIVNLDGIELKDSYKIDEEDDYYDVYKIDYLFRGKHSIQIQKANMKKYNDVIYNLDSDVNYKFDSLVIDKKLTKKLSKQAKKDFKTFFKSAIDRKRFRNIKNLFVNNKIQREYCKENYNQLINFFNAFDVYFSQITDIKFKDISMKFDYEEQDKVYNVLIEFDYDFITATDYDKGDTYTEDYNYIKFSYVSQNKKFKIIAMDSNLF